MNSLKNQVTLIGHLGSNPEIKNTDSGKKYARFNVATNESYRNANGEKITDTQWHTITAWGKSAESVEKLLEKGCNVALNGKLINKPYKDKNGNPRNFVEIQLNDFLLLKP